MLATLRIASGTRVAFEMPRIMMKTHVLHLRCTTEVPQRVSCARRRRFQGGQLWLRPNIRPSVGHAGPFRGKLLPGQEVSAVP